MLTKAGLTQEHTPPRTHCIEVERQIRTIKESTTAFLQAAKIELTRAAALFQSDPSKPVSPYVFWPDAAEYSCYTLNKMPYVKDGHKSSNQIWDPRIEQEDMSKLRVFGAKVYCKNYESLKTDAPALSKASQREEGQSTFPTWGAKGWQGIFLGFDPKVPDAWRVLSFKTKAFQQTIHMVANENLEASAPPQNFTRESLLTLLHLRQHIPLTAHQTTAFDQIISDNFIISSMKNGILLKLNSTNVILLILLSRTNATSNSSKKYLALL